MELPVVTPRDLKGWIPPFANENHDNNQNWATNALFDDFGEFLASRFLEASMKLFGSECGSNPKIHRAISMKRGRIASMGDIPLYLAHHVRKGIRSGYRYKSYARISPTNYHPNCCQMFLEAHFERGFGGQPREPTDWKLNRIKPFVQKDEIVLFLGLTAIKNGPDDPKRRETRGSYTMIDKNTEGYDEATVGTHFNILNEAVLELDDEFPIDEFHDAPHEPECWTPPLEGRVSRFRIRLPRQSLDEQDWSQSKLDDAVERMAAIVLPHFIQIAE